MIFMGLTSKLDAQIHVKAPPSELLPRNKSGQASYTVIMIDKGSI